MNTPRQPPQLIGLGPDSTPPSGAETGTPEQRLGAGIESVHADVRDLMIGRVDQLAREQRETKDDVELLKDSVSALVDVVGKPPQTEALARASSQDLSPAAVEALDLGTGLHRMITRLAVDNIQAARRAGRREGTKGAVVGGGVTAIAVAAITHADKLEHLMRSLLGG